MRKSDQICIEICLGLYNLGSGKLVADSEYADF